MSHSPLSFLNAAGTRANHILPLTLFTLIVSIVVCIVIGVLLWMAVKRAPAPRGVDIADIPVQRGGNGLRWISVGLAISGVPLLITLVWTMFALGAVAGPPDNPALTLDVTARQWWWEVQYNGASPSEQFSTANEIHIPIGKPVLVRLHAGDVIHSFWVPKLSGKTDVIPGQTNQSWLQADAAGRYLGQCSEYCGWQHAHMQFEVVAQSDADFVAWLQAQRTPARGPDGDAAARGLEVAEQHCARCHTVRGTAAGSGADHARAPASASTSTPTSAAPSGPDLTHLMSRRTIAAGTLFNTPASLADLIQHSQEYKPGSLMPDQDLSARQLAEVVAYLTTLQ